MFVFPEFRKIKTFSLTFLSSELLCLKSFNALVRNITTDIAKLSSSSLFTLHLDCKNDKTNYNSIKLS